METGSNSRVIGRQLWQLSYPTMIAMALQSFYDLVDMAWVGQISKEAVAGVTLFSTIYMLFGVLNDVVGSSSVSMISQSYGRNDHKRVQVIAEQTISFKVLLALISATLMLIFLKPLLSFYTDVPDVREAALSYGYIRIFFLPLNFASYSINTVFRCTGDAKTPMRIMIVATILNIVLDPLFIFDVIPGTSIGGLGMGVFGAALATVIAATVSFLYGFIVLISGRRDVTISFRGLFRLDRAVDRQLIVVGLPSGLQLLVRQLFNAILLKFVTIYGTVAITVMGIGGKLIGFSLMPLFGLQMAGSAMVGHALGRDHVDEAKLISKISSIINVAITSVFAAFFIAFPRVVMRLFSNEAPVIEEGVYMIRMISIAIVIIAYSFGRKIVFAGAGHNRPQLYAGIFSRWVVQLPAVILIVIVLKLPLQWLWVTFIIAELGEYAFVYYHLRKGEWETKRV